LFKSAEFKRFNDRDILRKRSAMGLLPKTLKWSTLKHHYALVPLAGALGFGMSLSIFYTLRLAIQNPDVSWRRYSNPEPWQHRVDDDGKAKRYKFFQGPADYKVGQTKYGVNNFPEDRPPIEKWWAEYQAEQKANAAPSHH